MNISPIFGSIYESTRDEPIPSPEPIQPRPKGSMIAQGTEVDSGGVRVRPARCGEEFFFRGSVGHLVGQDHRLVAMPTPLGSFVFGEALVDGSDHWLREQQRSRLPDVNVTGFDRV